MHAITVADIASEIDTPPAFWLETKGVTLAVTSWYQL